MEKINKLVLINCECCGEYHECSVFKGLYLCEKCTNHFSISFEANHREKEEENDQR